MLVSSLCGPAVIYIGFSLIQIVIDLYKNLYSSAFIKLIVMLIIALTINVLCEMGLTIIAWFLVFIPIIMMTIISTLLLKTFGTNPNEDYLRSKVLNESDSGDQDEDEDEDENEDKDQNENEDENNGRIDRDLHRQLFYDDIEEIYDLSSSEQNFYDLSNNKKKYIVADLLLNSGNNFLVNAMDSLRSRFSNFGSFSGVGSNNMINPLYAYSNTNTPYLSNLPMTMTTDFEIRKDNMDGTDFESYEKKYADRIYAGKSYMDMGGEGFFIFRQENYNKTKNDLENSIGREPSREEIDKEIEKDWSVLSSAVQDAYNREANDEQKDSSYSADDFTRYRSPFIEIDYSRRRDTQSYEPCPPGKERNSGGTCVRPCPIGQERLIVNGDCKDIKI